MKFNHIVKYGDVYYKAGEEVPIGEAVKQERTVEKKKVEPKEETKFDASELEPVVEIPKSYSKTDIMKMSRDKLIEELNQYGIAFEDEASNADLKKLLVAHFGL